MKLRVFVLALVLLMGACGDSTIIENEEFIKMSIFNEMPQVSNNWGNGESIVIKDKNTISEIINKINNGPRNDLSEISYEHGPPLRIVFEGKNDVRREVKAFISGTVVANNYEILAEINFDDLKNE